MKRFFLILATLGALNGCVSLSTNDAPVSRYDFGLPVRQASGPNVVEELALEVKTPGWFDSLYVDFRLAYDDPLKQREYSASRWAANPGVLLDRFFRQKLGISTRHSTASSSQCLLQIDLNEFTQIFVSPDNSHALLEADARLIGSRQELLAKRRFSITESAKSANAGGGVRALVTSVESFCREIALWLAELENNGAFKACR